MLTPTILAPDYPLSSANAEGYLWNEIPEQDKTVRTDGRTVSYEHMSYSWALEDYES